MSTHTFDNGLVLFFFLFVFPLRFVGGGTGGSVDAEATADGPPPKSTSIEATNSETPERVLFDLVVEAGSSSSSSEVEEGGASVEERRESEDSEVMEARRAAVVRIARFWGEDRREEVSLGVANGRAAQNKDGRRQKARKSRTMSGSSFLPPSLSHPTLPRSKPKRSRISNTSTRSCVRLLHHRRRLVLLELRDDADG